MGGDLSLDEFQQPQYRPYYVIFTEISHQLIAETKSIKFCNQIGFSNQISVAFSAFFPNVQLLNPMYGLLRLSWLQPLDLWRWITFKMS